MPIFGTAYAAPNKVTAILYGFRSLSTVLSPTENSRIQGLFKAFERFCSTFQGRFNFQGLFKKSPLNSSSFQACANPASAAVVIGALRLILCMLGNFACFCFFCVVCC